MASNLVESIERSMNPGPKRKRSRRFPTISAPIEDCRICARVSFLANDKDGSSLCESCSRITFSQLSHGFKHELGYEETVLSGEKCMLCRLMVCAIARLDEYSPLDLSQYSSSIPELLKVYREQKMDMDFLSHFLGDVKVQMVQKLQDFGWENINGNQESR
jgi:hypothetical protein